MKKLVTMILVVCLLLATVCGALAEEKKVIALCVAQVSNEFQSRIKDAMEKYAEDNGLNDKYEFTVFDANFDTAKQLEQVENAIGQGAAGVVMIPVDMKGSVPAVQACLDAGVPVVGCNSDIEDNTLFDCYVGSDTVDSGHIEMQALAEAMGGEGKLVEMEGNYGESPQILRDQGIRDIVEQYPDIEIVYNDTGKWSRDEAKTKMENWIMQGLMDDAKAVVCHNDAMAVGCMMALEENGMNDILIAGIDANADMLGYLKEGRVAVTVFQNAAGQGEGAIKAVVDLVEGKEVPQFDWIPYELVTVETADDYLALLG
ncbi:MAG: substrate-binding domain-containing protein [Clostridia bacterium]|nr:substrate-binding domain-containing protein [Clostridia bacterium]